MKPYIYAHRGVSSLAPENTMPAFLKAAEMGADGIELDVQLSKDGIPVIIHDETLRRTTTGNGYVKDTTYQELKKLDAGRWFSPEYIGTTIPSLKEFAKWAATTKLKINVELKTNKIRYEGIEAKVIAILEEFKLSSRTVISSFNHDSLKVVHELAPALSIAPLSSKKIAKPCEYAKSLGGDSIHLKYRLLNRRLLAHCRKQNVKVRTYTVNSSRALNRCFRIKVDAIVTDVPQKALALLKDA